MHLQLCFGPWACSGGIAQSSTLLLPRLCLLLVFLHTRRAALLLRPFPDAVLRRLPAVGHSTRGAFMMLASPILCCLIFSSCACWPVCFDAP